jgi:hypothetical protein
LRKHLVQERGLGKAWLYAVPYWKDGQDEESYHEERHDIMDSMDTEPA